MYNISGIKPEDKDTVCELENALFSEADRWSKETIKEIFESTNWLVLVIKRAEEIIGYCMIYHILESSDLGKIAIKPEYRSAGAGSYLLESAIETCKKLHSTEMLLEVRESNALAISFYKRQGFHMISKRKSYYNNPREDGIVMKKKWNDR